MADKPETFPARIMNKQQFLTLAEGNGVEVEITKDPVWGGYHIHAYAPSRKRFTATDTHNLNLGEHPRLGDVMWRSLGEDIQLRACDPESCEPDCWAIALTEREQGEK